MLRAEILGNLGATAEVREVNGARFVAFNVADSSKITDPQTGEVRESTTWISCTVNRDLSNLLPYLQKGTKVFCRGRIAPRVYVGHDGQKHAGINMYVTEIELAGGRQTDVNDVKGFILNTPEKRQEVYDYICTFADNYEELQQKSESAGGRGNKKS